MNKHITEENEVNNNTQLVKFEKSRDGGPMCRIAGAVSFPDRKNSRTAKVGEIWEVAISGKNQKGTVNFLTLVHKVNTVPCKVYQYPASVFYGKNGLLVAEREFPYTNEGSMNALLHYWSLQAEQKAYPKALVKDGSCFVEFVDHVTGIFEVSVPKMEKLDDGEYFLSLTGHNEQALTAEILCRIPTLDEYVEKFAGLALAAVPDIPSDWVRQAGHAQWAIEVAENWHEQGLESLRKVAADEYSAGYYASHAQAYHGGWTVERLRFTVETRLFFMGAAFGLAAGAESDNWLGSVGENPNDPEIRNRD